MAFKREAVLLSRTYRAFHCGPLPASPGPAPISASPANTPPSEASYFPEGARPWGLPAFAHASLLPGRLVSTCDPYVYRSLLRPLPQLSCLLGCIGGSLLGAPTAPPAQPACDVWCLPRGQSPLRPGPTVMCVPCHVSRLSLTEVGE